MRVPSAYIEKSLRSLSASRILLENKEYEGACNRAYYAIFNAAHAALLSIKIEIPEVSTKSHRGLISAFGKYIVNGNYIEAKFGRMLNRVERLRLIADYTGDIITLEHATLALENAELFIKEITTWLNLKLD